MSHLTFFRQRRFDGGTRIGIDLDGATVCETFVGGAEDDPRLLWFVDLRCEGRISQDPATAVSWLIENGPTFSGAFASLADDLAAGYDTDRRPIQFDVQSAPAGVRARIVVSMVRRVDALSVSDVLRESADSWEQTIRELQPSTPQPA